MKRLLVLGSVLLAAVLPARAMTADEVHHAALTLPRLNGLWCGTGLLHEFSLLLAQQYRDVNGTLVRRERVREIIGRMDGDLLRTQSTKVGSLVLHYEGDALRIVGGDGPIALARGMVFKRAAGPACR